MEDKTPAAADALQTFDSDGTMFLFGVVPLIVIGALAVVWVALYLYKKKQTERDLASAMIDDSEAVKVETSNISTRDIQDMDPTKPSQRLSETPRSKAE